MTAALSLMELCFAVLSIPVINSFVVSLGLICIEWGWNGFSAMSLLQANVHYSTGFRSFDDDKMRRVHQEACSKAQIRSQTGRPIGPRSAV